MSEFPTNYSQRMKFKYGIFLIIILLLAFTIYAVTKLAQTPMPI
jgi:flagellar biogenesis protein FliO